MTLTMQVSSNMSAARAMLDRLDDATQYACTETAKDVRTAAIPYARKDTESMILSIYVQTPTSSDYGDKVSAASSVNPDAQFNSEGPTPERNSAAVDVAVKHGVWNEYGSAGGESGKGAMAAQPFMGPAGKDCRHQPRVHFREYLRAGGGQPGGQP